MGDGGGGGGSCNGRQGVQRARGGGFKGGKESRLPHQSWTLIVGRAVCSSLANPV